MSYNPQNPNGSATSANSSPVVVASDQAAIAIKVKDGSGNSITSTSSALDVNIKTNAATNQSVNVAQINGTTPSTDNGTSGAGVQRVTIASDSTGQVALATGTNAIGSANLSPTASGGWSAYFANAITTTVTVNGSAGKFGGYMLINLNSAPAYLQVFDTTAAVTLGTTTPTFVLPLPANGTAANGTAANLELANGIRIANGIKVAATTTASGSTTVSTGLSGSIWYK